MRLTRADPERDEPERPARQVAPAPPSAARILALQRSAGNAAVNRLLRSPGPGRGAATATVAHAEEAGDQDEPEPDPLEALQRAIRERTAARGRPRDTVPAPPPPGWDVVAPAPQRPLRDSLDGPEPMPDVASGYHDGGGPMPDVVTGYHERGPRRRDSLSEDDDTSSLRPPGWDVVQPAPQRPLRDSLQDSDEEDSLDEDNPDGGGPVAPPPARVPPRAVPPAPPRAAPAAPPAAAAPPARRRGRGKRVLKALTKPFRALGSALRGLVRPRRRRPALELEDEPALEPSTPRHPLADDASEDLRAPQFKYSQLLSVPDMYKGEKDSSGPFVADLIYRSPTGLYYDMVRWGLVQFRPNEYMTVVHNRTLVREALKRLWGWTEEDVATYYDTQRLDRLKTKYITDPQELAQYAVVPGPVFKDARGNPLDTSTMISKASGPGWGIFVMAEDGKLFVGRHKVGLFHHSSFTAGEDVASAGELQVIGGTLKGITAKSGHYMPTPAHMVQLLHRLDAAGADLAGVPCKVWLITRETGARTLVYDSADLLANGDKARVLSEGAMY